MTTVNLANIVPTATKRFRQAYTLEIGNLIRDIGVVLLRFEGSNGAINPRFKSTLLRQIGERVQRVYVGSDARSAYAEDGISPVSPYAATLNEAFVEVTTATVLRYQTQLRNTLPDDLFQRLAQATVPNLVLESLNTLTSGTVPYVSPFTWLDPRGLQLSDRIWRTSLDVRTQVDTILSRGIRRGWGAAKLSRELELYLKPESRVPTNLPYGRSASFPAMRLARTEIARAANEASLVALKLHPYYNLVDVVRSGRGDPNCAICASHASINISGSRVMEPYALDAVPKLPLHPHCMCHYQPNTENVDVSSERLRARVSELEPHANPASGNYFTSLLLGTALSRLIPGIVSRLQGVENG